MKLIIPLFLLKFSLAFAQPDWVLHDSFDIGDWEVTLNIEEKLALLKENNFSAYDEWLKQADISKEEYLDMIHFGYFDKDESLDLIVIGYFGAEVRTSSIYLHNGSNYQKVVQVGDIDRLEYGSYSIPKIIAHQSPCCEDITHTITVSSPNSDISYQKEVIYYYDEGTVIPKIDDVIGEFEVLSSPYHLRKSPEIDDKFKSEYQSVGNIVHSYNSGAKGVAYDAHQDSTGRVWWFVQMSNPNPDDGIHFPALGTYYLGWMSSRYLMKK